MIENQKQRGKFIVFEGPDGFGKSTQAQLTRKYMLEEIKLSFIISREPGSIISDFCQDLREIIFHKEYSSELDEVEQGLLLFLDHYEHAIQTQKLINMGINVISDRWLYSQYAYDAIKPKSQIDAINLYQHYETLQIQPDLVLLFGLDKEEGYRRIKEREEKGEKKTKQSQKPWVQGDYLGELIKQYSYIYYDLVDKIPVVDITPRNEETKEEVFEEYVKPQIDEVFKKEGE